MMADRTDVALLISTYQRPFHLERVLASVACQQGVNERMEVVVTDDGSTDETADVVARFAQRCPFPVSMTTHPHNDFQLAKCRNDGVRASTAPYLIFLDGDCLLPPDHIQWHLKIRRPGTVWAGYCYRLDPFSTAKIDLENVVRGDFLDMAPQDEIRNLDRLSLKSRFYSFIKHPAKPRLFGGNVGIFRSDYERVNGYDENFVGWGGEDDDLRIRLRSAGVSIRSILQYTRTYHLWHPPCPSSPETTSQGRNIAYLTRRKRLTACRRGLQHRDASDLHVRVLGPEWTRELVRDSLGAVKLVSNEPVDIEIAVASETQSFSGQADWNLLLDTGDGQPTRLAVENADLVVSDRDVPLGAQQDKPYSLADLAQAVRAVV